MTLTPDAVRQALDTVQDPELGLGLVALGLVYDVAIAGPDVTVTMTFTAEGCPLGDAIEAGVRRVVGALPGVGQVRVHVTFSPPWCPERIDPAALQVLRGDAES